MFDRQERRCKGWIRVYHKHVAMSDPQRKGVFSVPEVTKDGTRFFKVTSFECLRCAHFRRIRPLSTILLEVSKFVKAFFFKRANVYVLCRNLRTGSSCFLASELLLS